MSINWSDNRNLNMLTDFYEFTMANGYFLNGYVDKIAYFDLFFRKTPDGGGFAIFAGLEQVIDFLNNLSFNDGDIEYLRSKNIFSEDFLEYLKNFRFTCDVWAIPEGTPVFPGEPLLTVRGPIIQAQLIETMLLLSINHQSLIATKANRIVRAAAGRPVMEFGARRAHSYDGAIFGSRAAYIGGCIGTSCTISDRDMKIPAAGTMAHSWIQVFDDELEAFRAYARIYPHDCTLLVDTYNVLKSGIPNAIRVFNEEVVPRGFRPKGVRIDSGDLTYLSIEARKMLDEAGFPDCGIIASNALDEYLIRDLLVQGAKVDSFGVGERLITSKSDPVFGGVYKLAGIEKDGVLIPKIKVSENVDKITNPSHKQVYRFYDKKNGKALADVVTLFDEEIDETKPYEIFDPIHTWKRKTLTDYAAKKLLVKVFDGGKCIYKNPALKDVQKYCKEQVDTLWEDVSRIENPRKYYVDLSYDLWALKNKLLNEFS